ALLVRADGEAEVPRLDRLLVGREHDAAAGDRHALDADQDPHARTRAFSGSNSGVEPARATVTGKRCPRYSTESCSPSRACSDGRYAIRRYCPSDGPEPALVTNERRPFASVSGVPSRVSTGSRPSM